MSLVVSLLVLVISLVILSPILDAFPIPGRKIKEPVLQTHDNILTANQGVYADISAQAQKSSYVKKQKILHLNKLMSENALYGIWTGGNKKTEAAFGGHEGFTTLKYAAGHHLIEESFDMTLCLYNGLYTNTNYTCISMSEFIPFIPENALHEENSTLEFGNIVVHIAEGHSNNINDLGKECTANVTLSFVDNVSKQPFFISSDEDADQKVFGVQFKVSSNNEFCPLDFSTNTMTQEDTLIQGQSMKYTVTMSIAAVFQCLCCFIFEKLIKKNKVHAQKINQGTLRVIQCFDLYITLKSILQLSSNMLIGLVAIPYGILSFYFETRAIRAVIQAQGNLHERGFSCLHRLNQFFFFTATIVAFLCTVFKTPEWMFFTFALHQIPQIYQNFSTERKYNKKQYRVLLFIIPKLIYITYVFGIPRNLFRYSPRISYLILFGNILFLQVVLLVAQGHFPKLCLKSKSLYKFYSIAKKTQEEVCSICLENLETTASTPTIPTVTKGKKDLLIDEKNFEDKDKLMVLTPCQHEFHECCLRDWTKLKSVCPYCRYQLPPLPEEDD